MSNTRLSNRLQSTQVQPHLSRRKLYAAMLVASQWMAAGQLWAAPEGGEVVGGAGVIEQSGVDTMIHQATERIAIDWKSFDVAANERVEFIQPSSSSIALNRVLSNRGSEILGRIDSNGQVMLVNPNGVVFGKDSIINVGGMIASGLNIDPASFINGDFALNSMEGMGGKVINYGIINAATGGSVTLVGQQVQNDGLISAKLGAVNLAAGKEAVLTFDQSGLVGVKVTEAVLQNELGVDAAVINSGDINAEGGRVLLSASVSEDIFSNAVNHAGMNKASSVVVHDDGSFTLGAGSDVINTGDISTSVPTGAAGQVVVVGTNITSSGTIAANTGAGSAGAIELHSNDTTLVTEAGSVSAQATTQGEGGDIKVLGNKVGLFDAAQVNASGANGGGQVLIGGDKTGQNQKVRNADFIYLGENTSVKADALIDGNGGKLITFASDTARIYGNLYSRGGSEGGKGGFIETSGLEGFEILNTPDITASAGSGGTWLIDPRNITINNSNDLNGVGQNGDTFTSNGSPGNLGVQKILGALDNGSIVIIQTAGGTGDGDITLAVGAALNFNFSTNATLRLLAHNDINLNGNIVRATKDSNDTPIEVTGTLNLELIANKDNRGGTDGNTVDGADGGSINIANNVTIATNGGYFYAGKSAQEVNGLLVSSGDYTNKVFNFTSEGTINTSGRLGGGDIVINATNDVSLGALAFGYDYLQANSYSNESITNALVRVGSVTVNSGRDVTLNGAINFNNTGKRRGDGSNGFATSPAPTDEETFLKIDAFGDITISGLISDVGYGDARDSLNIDLTADKNNATADRGTISISNDIYTAGGNFTASAYAFNSFGKLVNTDRANALSNSVTTETLGNGRIRGIENGNAQHSNGGDITISAVSAVSLGSIVTDKEATSGTRSGNLVIQGVDQNVAGISSNNLNVSQNGLFEIAGTTTFNVGTGTDSKIELLNANNKFTGSLLFKSANNVSLNGLSGLTLGDTTIAGNLVLTSGGDVKFQNTDAVPLAQNIKAASVSVTNSGAFFSGNINTSDAADGAGGNVTIKSTGTVAIGDIDASAGAATNGKNGGAVELSGNSVTVGRSNDTLAINTSGSAGTLANGGGGNITIKANAKANNDESYFITVKGNLNASKGDAADTTTTNGVVKLDLVAGTFTGTKGAVTLDSDTFFNTNIQVTGDAGSDTFTGPNTDNIWQLGSGTSAVFKSNAILGPKIEFSKFETIVGGSGENSLQGIAQDNDWQITAANAGSVKLNGPNTAINFSNFKNVIGNSGVDVFTFSAAGAITGTVNGGSNADTIIGRDVDTTWTLTNADEGRATYIQKFTNIQNLTGGTAADIFDFSTSNSGSLSGTINGGLTDETPTTPLTAATANTIKARTGLGVTNTWKMTGNNAGSLVDTTSSETTYVGSFSSIQAFAGAGKDTMSFALVETNPVNVKLGATGAIGVNNFVGSTKVESTLIGEDKDTIWIISGADAGTLDAEPLVSGVISFSQFKNITGGTAADIFDFTTVNTDLTRGSLSGTIDGGDEAIGAKNEIIARKDVLNTWAMTGNSAGSLAITSASTKYVNDFESIQVFTGADNDTMSFAGILTNDVEITLGVTGSRGIINFVGNNLSNSKFIKLDGDNTWKITGENSGEVNGTDGKVYSFSNFWNLTGGSEQDTFIFEAAGSLQGRLHGQNGLNTLLAKDVTNNWVFTAANVGTISAGVITYLANFTNIQVLQGGSDVDTFNLSNNFTGTINGGAGNDVFNINAAVTTLNGEAGNDRFIFSSAANAGAAANIDGGADTNALIGRVDNNTWTISSQNAGTLGITSGSSYVTTFTNIQSLNGSASADTFNINAEFAGSINSGAGDNIFNINAAVGNLVGGGDNDLFNFLANGSANSIDGAGGTNNLVGKNIATTWDVNLAESGSLTASGLVYLNSFSRIQNLQGGTAADTFNLNAAFSGLINGGNGADGFNINAVVNELQGGDDNDSFVFSSALNGGVATTIDGGTGANTLTGRNGNNTWTIAVANSGTLGVTGELTNYVNSFSNIRTLNGDAGNDTFILNSAFSGSINAGAGTNIFNVNAVVGALTGGDGNDNFVFGTGGSATTVNGGIGNNQITARDGLNTWNLSVANGGSLQVTGGANYINTFSNIQTLLGGNNVDIFNINQSFAGSLYGGLGDDSFRFTSANNTGSVVLIDGGAGINNLMGRNEASIWTITAENTGTLGLNSGSMYVTDFRDIQSLIGGSEIDTFVINAAVNNTIDAGSGNNIFNINAAVGSLVGGDGNDRFVFSSLGAASSIDGAGGSNTLQAKDIANTWTLSAGNQGALASAGINYVSLFSSIQTLQGGSNIDLFNLNFRFDGVIRGGAGNDSFAINAQANQLYGGDDNDSFVFSSANNQGYAALIDGGSGVNSLTGRNAANTWTINSQNAGVLSVTNTPTYVTSFTSVQTLNGGNDADTFVINANVSNGIFSGAGNNIFNVNTFVESLVGGADNDRFVIGADGSANSVDGGLGINELVARNNQNNIWTMTATDQGQVAANGINYINNFSNIKTLQGSNLVDIFNLSYAFSGTVKGGAGSDIFNIGAATHTLQGEGGNDSFDFSSASNAGSAQVIDGGAANESNSLIGRDAANVWNITSENTGILGLISGSYVAGFSNIQILNGGSGADNFIINAAVSNAINAGGGNNSFTINAAVGNITGGDSDEAFIFGALGSANNLNGGGGNNTLAGRNGNNTWNTTGVNQGRLMATNGSTYVDSFSNIQALQGGSSVDVFNINHNFAGTISGGAGSDIFNIDATTNNIFGEAGTDSFIFDNAGRASLINGGIDSDTDTLIARNSSNTWSTTAVNEGFIAVTNGSSYLDKFLNIQILQGGNAVDIFNFNSDFSGTAKGGSGADIFNIDAVINSLEGETGEDSFIFNSVANKGKASSIDGGDDINSLTGRDADSIWKIIRENGGALEATDGSYVVSFNKIQILNGGVAADTFEIGATITREINSGNGNNIFKINTAVNNLLGGAGNDQFIFGALGSAQSINGSGGNNSLTGRDAENFWNITGSNSGNIQINNTSYLASFSNIQTLQGGANVDVFIINDAVDNLFGNAGNDKFLFNASNNGRAVSIDGGIGSNTLRGQNIENSWIMLTANAGTLSSTIGNVYVSNFSSVNNLEGGNASDTLYAVNQNNDWSITANNTGNLKASGAPASAQVAFDSIENLVGAQGTDKFIFTASQSYITGLIDGGTSVSADSLDLSAVTGGITVELGNIISDNLNIVNVESITANANNSNANALIGASDTAYRWTVSALNSGSIQDATSVTDTGISFANFGELRGGTNSDRFNVQASVSNSISGGDGDGQDLVDYSNRRESFTITLGRNGSLGSTGIRGIEGIIGNSGAATNAYNSTIEVTDGDNIWTIGVFDTVTDGLNDGEIQIGGKTVSFENFNHLIGGSGKDSFNYSAQGQLVGTIDGRGANNTIDASRSIKDQEFHLNDNAAGVTNLVSISSLVGNATTNSALVSAATANIWNVNNQSVGELNSALNFSGIANLTGGAFKDVFTLESVTPFTGIIDGGAGADEIDLKGIAADISVGIGATAIANLKLNSVESITANEGRKNTLIADNQIDNAWLISGKNTGTLNTSIGFTGFANLTGRETVDTFTFANEQSNITGWIDAGAGIDRLNLTNSNRDLIVRVSSANDVLNSGEITANNFEVIDADVDNNNKLIAKDVDNVWNITSVNGGSLNDGTSPAITFTNFKNLMGGNQDDHFIFNSVGSITGLIDGGAQRDRDVVNVSESSNANIVISSGNGGYINIEKYVGNNTTSTITADNVINNWAVTNNGGTINSTIEFEQFVNLIGGNGQDIFSLNDSILSGIIDGSDGNDTFSLVGNITTGEIRGGRGDDEFRIAVASGLAGNTIVSGGDGINRLVVSGGDAGYKASHQRGVLQYANSANTLYTANYSGIAEVADAVIADSLTLWETSAIDTFTLQNNKYQLDSGLSINYSQKQNLIINASPTDSVVIDGNVTIPKMLTINNATVVAHNGGKVIADSLELVATKGVGSLSSRLQLAANDLRVKSTEGDIYLNEQDSLTFSDFTSSSLGIFDIVLGGDLLSTSAINYSGKFKVDGLRGNIVLNNANSFAGDLNLKAAGDIRLKNITSLNFSDLTAQNLALESDGDIRSQGSISVSAGTSISAKGKITLTGANNDFNELRVLAATDVSLNDKNKLTLTGILASGNVSVNANGLVAIGAPCVTTCVEKANVTSGSLLEITSAEDIQMESSALVESTSGNIIFNAKNISLASVRAINGGIKTVAAGAITDNNEAATNIYAQRWNAEALWGIGVGYQGGAGQNAIETEISILSAKNAGKILGKDTTINIVNSGTLTIEQLRNNGDISLTNLTGDILLDHSDKSLLDVDKAEALDRNENKFSDGASIDLVNNDKYDPSIEDARMQGGVINANTGIYGGTLSLNIQNGMVRGLGKAVKNNPDIIAESGFFNYPSETRFSFGERKRNVVMHIPANYKQSARTSSIIWYKGEPDNIVDSSTPLQNLVSNEQLIQIEALNEIDPAIFTSVSNYIHDEVAILMPIDQRFDDEEYTE